jgi:HK97 gp10 family phage protein
MTMTLKGEKQLTAQLEALAEANYVPALEEGVKETIFPEMQRLTPVDEGDLKASEEVRRDGNAIVLFAGTDHALHVEFGTFKMSPQPYMRPAIDTQSDACMRATAEKVNQIMVGTV